MPLRRQSATPSPRSLRSPPPSIRPRDSSDTFSINEVSPKDTALGEQKVIAALVGRLVNKLPCNSGSRLPLMETDPAVRHIVSTLINLVRIKPALVVQQLASALETLSKYTNTPSSYDVPLDILHSQIYILHTLYLCLSESWRMYAEAHAPPRSALPQSWPDLPPLDESLAKYVLAVTLFYARMTSAEAPPIDTSNPSWQTSSQDARTVASTSMASSGAASSVESRFTALGPVFIQQHTYPAGSSVPVSRPPERFITRECLTTHNAVQFMSRINARIIFFLSTSNWSLVFARIKLRLVQLISSTESNAEFVELRLLEWCNVDRVRVTQALQEISSSFLNLKRPAQIAAASSLRKSMWNWIEIHPGEFQVLIESGRNIDRSAEILFDVLYSASDLSATSFSRRTRAFYPMMSMLLVVCPEMLKRAAMGGMGGKLLGSSKKATFLENFRKGITSSKGFEAAVVCHIDIIRASGYVSPELESSGLKTIGPDMHVDLRNALFFSPLSKEITDHSVYVDGLVTLYRVKTPAKWTALFGRLFADTNEVNGKTAIRACAAIQRGGQRLPWFPTMEEFRKVTGPVVRNLLKIQSATLLGDIKAVHRPRASPVFGNSQTDIVSEILQLYWVDPQIAFGGTSSTDNLQDLLHLTSALMVSPSPEEIRGSAASANVAILNALVNADPAILQGCAPHIWQMLLDACRQCMFATQSDHENVIPSFTAARDISVALDKVAEKHPDILSSSPRGEAATLLGKMTFTTVLVSPDVEQLAQSTPALQALAKLTLVAHKTYIPGISVQGTNFTAPEGVVLTRYKIFEALIHLPPANGRVQQQKQFRKVWRATAEPTTGAISTWLGLSQVVRDLTAKILAADSASSIIPREHRRRGLALDIDGLDEDEAKFWQNTTYFLAASAITCQYEVLPPPLVDVIGAGLLPRMYEELPDSIKTCEVFIRQLVDLLVSRSIHVRETAKDALGAELDPSLFPIMIDQMTKLISHARGSSGMIVSETFNNFVDQTLIIFRLTMERIALAEKQGGSSNVKIDLGDLLHLLVQYINRLGRDDAGLRIKLRFCHKTEMILARSASVVWSHESSVKNAIVDCLVEWATDAGRDLESHRHVPGASLRLYRELEFTCLRTMVRITDGLVLRSPGEENDTTQLAVKSRLFYRYYSFLIKVLEKSHSEIESVRGSSIVGSHLTVTYEDAPNLAITALSNLLSSNIDVGLKHCLTLGYHDDPTLRTAFMRLLLNVLQQGTRFGGLTTKRYSSAPKAYLELLTANPNNLALAVALCEACTPSELDDLSMLLFRVFEAKGILLDFLKIMTEREIALTSHESELFRANSITTRILTIFAKTYGYNYVRATLQPLVHSLVEKPAECSFELDPSKAGPDDDIERNADHLQLMCQALLDLICSSTPRAPIMFRALCNHLWETIAGRFPESRHSVIGSFIFLRFFCPAIVAPENIDLDVSPDTRETRRALLLITKVIQNLANNVVFGNKEPHMKVLNGFLSENIRQVTKFLSDLAVKPKPGDLAAAIEAYQEDAERLQDFEGDESILHRFISNNLPKIESALESLPATYKFASADSRQDKIDLQGRAALADLRRVVQLTGAPVDNVKMFPTARQKAYDDFMKHNAGRTVDSVSGAFYEGPASQNGRRIFYFIVSRVGLLDYDLLAYHVFSILEKVTDLFDLVIDLTDFSDSTELPMAWLKRSIQICPPGILPCINTLALYNPNTYARRRVRKIIANLLTIAQPVGKNIVAASSPAELAESIPFTSLALPEYSMALAYEAEHVFTNLLCLSDHEQQVPVVVKLGHDCMQVASWRKQDLTSSVKSYIIDVVRLRDIDDILSGGALPSDHLVIKYGQNETVTFISRKRSEMAQIIRAARSRLRDGPSDERTLRPSDVPGTLLNVALLNLTSGDESLRLGAFNLINELSQYFKYDMALSVLKVTAGLNIPNNALYYVYSLSSALAQSAPHLTIEFLKEWTIGFSRADVSQKCASLHYVSPWLANLESFSKPSKDREDMSSRKSVEELVRLLVSITVAERRRLHLAIQEHVWAKLANAHESLLEIITSELMNTAIDAGLGSEKGEVAGDVLVSLANTSVRGRVIAKLRKTIAQTYLKPSASLVDNAAWSDISTLSRITLALSFNPAAALDVQLYLPELFHIITLMLGCGPLLVRQTVYGITVNIVQSLASTPPTGDMDNGALHRLLKRLQTKELFTQFGLNQNGPSFEAAPKDDEGLLGMVEEVTKFLGEVLVAGATSMDCANAWRARWMSLVAATCFQHNPATQPQAFTVLGSLASDEVDDDLVYQILVAMSTTLTHFGDGDNVLLISMLKCLCRIIPGLVPDSRYASSLFWLAVGVLELGYIPPFAAALELLLASLRAMSPLNDTLFNALMRGRSYAGEPARKLDSIAGVSFDTDVGFSLVGIIYKGVRHPSSRKLAIEALMELLRLTTATASPPARSQGLVCEDSVGFFMALLPIVASNPEEVRNLLATAGLNRDSVDVQTMSLLNKLSLPNNSTALLLVTLVTTIVQTASSEAEKIVLYRFLAEASVEMPEVVAMAYDTLIPRMTAVLSITSTISILQSVTLILEGAMSDQTYTFPSNAYPNPSESSISLQSKSYAASISSIPSLSGAREQVLEDLGMRGLGELNFTNIRADRVAPLARWVAALIDSFTV